MQHSRPRDSSQSLVPHSLYRRWLMDNHGSRRRSVVYRDLGFSRHLRRGCAGRGYPLRGHGLLLRFCRALPPAMTSAIRRRIVSIVRMVSARCWGWGSTASYLLCPPSGRTPQPGGPPPSGHISLQQDAIVHGGGAVPRDALTIVHPTTACAWD